MNRKVIFIGDAGVGKTSIVNRYAMKDFHEEIQATIGASATQIYVEYDDKRVDMSIWDTAGQERFRSLVPIFTKEAALAVLVFSINDIPTFENLNYWYTKMHVELCPDIPIILVANKIDLPQEVKDYDVENWAKEHDLTCIYVSAKTGQGVDDLFVQCAKVLTEANKVPDNEGVIDMTSDKSKMKSCC